MVRAVVSANDQFRTEERSARMSQRDELIAKYASDLDKKCGVSVDMDLLVD